MKQKLLALVLLAALLAGCTAADGSVSVEVASEAEVIEQELRGQEAIAEQAVREAPANFETGELRPVLLRGNFVDTPDGLLMGMLNVNEEASVRTGELVWQLDFYSIDVGTCQQAFAGTVSLEGTGPDYFDDLHRPPTLFYADGKLYYIAKRGVHRLDLENGGYETIYKTLRHDEEERFYEGWVYANAWYTDGEYLYGVMITMDSEDINASYYEPRRLVRLHLATGAIEDVYHLQPENESVFGHKGEEILLKCLVMPQNTHDFYSDDLTYYDDWAAQQNMAQAVLEVRAVDVKTGEMRVLWDSDEPDGMSMGFYSYIAISNRNALFWQHPLHDNDDEGPYELLIFEYETNGWRPLFESEEADCYVDFYDYSLGRMLVSEPDWENTIEYQYGDGETEEMPGQKYWVVEENSLAPPAEWRLLTPYGEPHEMEYAPMVPVAWYGGYYIVVTGQSQELVTLAPDGTFTRGPDQDDILFTDGFEDTELMWDRVPIWRYSLILIEDYWNSQANYLPLTVTES